MDNATAAQVKSVIDRAIQFKMGIELMGHPWTLDTPEYTMTTAGMEEVFDYVVTKGQ